MNNLESLFPIGFLGLFQLIGGIALGNGLRSLISQRSGAEFFLIIWGLGFGGIPLLIGSVFAAASGNPLLMLVGPSIYLGAILFGMLLLPWLVEAIGGGLLTLLAMGLLFMSIGSVAGFAMLRQGEIVGGLLFGIIFFAVGALLSGTGIWSLITDKPAV
jgi:hypothetical protein